MFRIKSRKGMETKWIVLIILALIGLVLGSYVIYVIQDAPMQGFSSYLCAFSNRFKALVPTKLKCVAPGTSQPVRFCKMNDVEINPQDWSKCNEEFGRLSQISPDAAVRNCTMQQILDRTVNCWRMGGQAKFNACSFMCDLGIIKLSTPPSTIDTRINDLKVLRDIHKKDIEFELGCRPGQDVSEKIIDEKVPGCSCNNVLNKLTDSYGALTVYNSLSIYFHDLIANNATVSGSSDGYLVHCAVKDYDVAGVSEKLFSLNNPSVGEVQKITGSYISVSSAECRNAFSAIQIALVKSRDYAQKILDEQKKVKMLLQKCVIGGSSVEIETGTENPTSAFEGATDRINFLMDETQKVTASVPAIESISESDLWEFAEQTKEHDRENTYAYALRSRDSVMFIGEYKIAPGAMFEISYCDASKIGSGILSGNTCGYFGKTQVQIGIQGSGAGGVSRTGSPYCHLSDTLLGEGLATSFCKGLFWKTNMPTQ